MGKEAVARELRRETKRTLGRQLEEFAKSQHRRLGNLEIQADAIVRRMRQEHDSRLYHESSASGRLNRIEGLTFWQRLSFLFFGTLPPYETAYAPRTQAQIETFWQDLGRPA